MRAERLIAIGTSAGGVEALKILFSRLSAEIPAAFCVAMHMLPMAESLLPAIIGKVTSLPVHDAVSEMPIEAGKIYIAPPNRHFILEDSRALLTLGPKENRSRPAIDPLFRSAASAYGPKAIGVVLTGMLDDGTAGLKEIKKQGGIAVVQSPKDAEYPDMPRSALEKVDVDYEVSLADMPELLRLLCDRVEQ